MEVAIDLLKALADETRFKIFATLLKRRVCVKGLAKSLSISEPAVSQHLKVLKNARLVSGKRRGHYIHYRVETETLGELIGFLGQLQENDGQSSPIDLNGVSKACAQMCHKSGEECMK